MKKLFLILSLFLAIGTYNSISAQNVSVNVNINLDRQPAWGPVGFDYVDFYYFPDINVYFDVNHGMFYYMAGRRWVSSVYLPAKYARYDLYGMYKVVLNHPDPWMHNKVHRKTYAHYRNNRTQVVIRNSHDPRYNVSRNNARVWVDNSSTKNTKTTTTNNRTNTTSRTQSAATNNRTNTTSRTQSTTTNKNQASSSSRTQSTSSSRSSSTDSNNNATTGSSRSSSSRSSGTTTTESNSSRSNRTR